MKLVNLTPHRITIVAPANWPLLGSNTDPIVVEPSGTVARCAEEREIVATLPTGTGSFDIPVYRAHFGAVQNLPEPQTGTVYIVSMRLAQAAPERQDVFFPGEAVRDGDGNIIGCIGLSRL